MNISKSKSGQSRIPVLAIVLVIVAVGGVVYFTSAPTRTRMNAAFDQYAHWTPENIAKDPENYLNFCEQQANGAVLKLKASQISVAQNHANLETMQKDATAKIAAGTKALAELKQLYTDADAAKKWPATWMGKQMDQDAVKRQIVSFSHQIAGQESLKTKTEAGSRPQAAGQPGFENSGSVFKGERTDRPDQDEPRDAEGAEDHRRSFEAAREHRLDVAGDPRRRV